MALTKQELRQRLIEEAGFMWDSIVHQEQHTALSFQPIGYVGVGGDKEGHPIGDDKHIGCEAADSPDGMSVAQGIHTIQDALAGTVPSPLGLLDVLALAGEEDVGVETGEAEDADTVSGLLQGEGQLLAELGDAASVGIVWG